jgi:hypothetical protein
MRCRPQQKDHIVRYYLFGLVYILCVGSFMLSGCASDTHTEADRGIYFVEDPSGTCGELDPFLGSDEEIDLGYICTRENLGGVEFTELSGPTWTIGCRNGGQLTWDTEHRTGNFYYACDGGTSNYEVSARGDVGSARMALVSQPETFRVYNSTFDGMTSLSRVNRMNACLRSWARTMRASDIRWDCFYNQEAGGQSTCTNLAQQWAPIYLTGCRNDDAGGAGEYCDVNIGIAHAGYCLWHPTNYGTSWTSQHYLSDGHMLLASEPGYTNKWTIN